VSQFILDDQLDVATVLQPLQEWTTAQRIRELRPGQRVLDERIPAILLTLRQPTFLTIDRDFWHSSWCHPAYCLVYFALRADEQGQIPALLRALLRRPEFRSRTARMGKLARVSTISIDFWQHPPGRPHHISWRGPSRRRG